MNNIQKIIKELKAEQNKCEKAVEKFKDANDEYAGFYRGKVEAFILSIQKLTLLLNTENEEQR